MMQGSEYIDALKLKHVCFHCVGEAFLSAEIEQNGTSRQCSYCGQIAESYLLHELAGRTALAFDQHYYRTPDEPDAWQHSLLADSELGYDWEREGEPILASIAAAAQIEEEVAIDLLAVLHDRFRDFESDRMGEETEFSQDSHYKVRGANGQAWKVAWSAFEQSLKYEARFFSRVVADRLASVFGRLDELKTKDNHPCVVDVGPMLEIDHLYRARVFQSEDSLKDALCRPDIHLGPPPANAACAGRMNAHGISVFYGAKDANVAIAEVRPPVGSKVAVARFDIIIPLRLLDLTALEEVQDGGSIFDASLKERLERTEFLKSLGQRLTRPVMPDDEHSDYLATQAVADFLATENEPLLDGIIFRSAQVEDGENVVLFRKAARVETMQFPDGTELEAGTGYETSEGWVVDFLVVERLPPPRHLSAKQDDSPHQFSEPMPVREDDPRRKALRIVLSSIEVHEVNTVEYRSTANNVRRHRGPGVFSVAPDQSPGGPE